MAITMIRTGLVLALCLLVLPYGMGLALCRRARPGLVYFGGLTASWTLFEILSLLFHGMLWSLRVMSVLWLVLCLAVAAAGYLRARGQRPKPVPSQPWTGVQRLLLAVVVAVVVLQTLNTVFNAYYGNWDDETYCSIAVTSWYTDTVNRCSTTSGALRDAFYNLKYVLPGWPVYSAALGVLGGLHPAIVYRTLLPVLEIPAAWLLGYWIIRAFFRRNRTRALAAMLLFQLLSLVAAERMTGTAIEWWMLVDCWTGKAVGGGIVVPLMLWLVLNLCDASEEGQRADLWKVLFLTGCAACFVSASLFFLIPVQLVLWGGCFLWQTGRRRDLWKFGVCMLPSLVCVAVTLF